MSPVIFFLMAVFFSSCEESSFREDVVFAGGELVTSKTLNYGKTIYTEYCLPCHGIKGDGKGHAAKGLQVPPRNFTLGVYKFGKVVSGELPHNEDFYSILDKGLKGTAMLPWDLTQEQKHAVVSYIKTFALKTWEGKDKALGNQILPSNDPYGLAHRESAIRRGREVYHIEAQCQSCHVAYASPEEISSMSVKLTGDEVTDFSSMYNVKPQDSDYGVKTLPPDFTWNEVRSAHTVEELYVRISAGAGGTAMPSWKGTITDDDIWAVAYYVKSLMDLKDSPERQKLMNRIHSR